MIASTEAQIWQRFLVFDRIRHYQQQLDGFPDMNEFCLNLSGSSLNQEAASLLAEAILRNNSYSPLQSLRIEELEATLSAWKILGECICGLQNLTRLFFRRVTLLSDDNHEDENDREKGEDTLARIIARRLADKESGTQLLKELHLV